MQFGSSSATCRRVASPVSGAELFLAEPLSDVSSIVALTSPMKRVASCHGQLSPNPVSIAVVGSNNGSTLVSIYISEKREIQRRALHFRARFSNALQAAGGEKSWASIAQLAAMRRGLCTRFSRTRAMRQLIRPPPNWPRIILPSHFRRSVTSPIDPQKRRSRRLQVRNTSIPTRHFLLRCIGRSFSACIVFPFFFLAPSHLARAPPPQARLACGQG